MKRAFAILLIPVYLLIALKFTINIHYCGGQLSEISIFKISEKDCCGVEEEMAGGCCSDDKITLKTDNHESQWYKIQHISAATKFILSTPSTFFVYNFSSQRIAKSKLIIEDPPPLTKTPFYIRFRVLLI